MDKQAIYIYIYVCVCVCVCARARAHATFFHSGAPRVFPEMKLMGPTD